MPGGLDHLVLMTRDLDAAAASFARMGFQLGVENVHPFGTKNRLIQLPGFFIELLAKGAPPIIPTLTTDAFSFAQYNRQFLDRVGEGASFLVLESHDANADQQNFERLGIARGKRFDFAREGRLSDGTPTELGFRLAFATHESIPDCGFFVCEQTHAPEQFWDPALQRHPNQARGVKGVVFTAENPSDHHIFFSALTGLRDMVSNSTGLRYETSRGDIEIITPVAFEDRYGEPAPTGVRLAALRLVTSAPATTAAMLEQGAVHFAQRRDGIVIPASAAHGLVVAFEAA
jgi:catechol 2,3-dioxygenase-like lactoylglutathione lyase family enzyme